MVKIAGKIIGSSDEGEAFDLWIDPGNATALEIADVLVALSEMHRAAGGRGLTFSVTNETRIV